MKAGSGAKCLFIVTGRAFGDVGLFVTVCRKRRTLYAIVNLTGIINISIKISLQYEKDDSTIKSLE